MIRLQSLAIACLTGILGLLCFGFLGFAHASWYHATRSPLSNQLQVLLVALAGGGASFVIGLTCAQCIKAAFIRSLAIAWTAVFAVSLAILAALMLRSDFPASKVAPQPPPVNMINATLPSPPQVRDGTPKPKDLP